MKTIITATVPTVYQLNSIAKFRLGHKQNRDGSFSAERDFFSKEHAEKHLKEIAESLADNDEELKEMFDDISKGYLRYDACLASITA